MTIEEILYPFSLQEFSEKYLGKQFCVIQGPNGRFSNIFDWQTINSILNTHRLEYPRLRLVQEGQRIEQENYQNKVVSRRGATNPAIATKKFGEFIRNGATLIIDAVNEMDNKVFRFSNEFEKAFDENVQVNAYIALSDNQGFNLHWDSHDVFVVQISGQKEWKVYDQTREFPMHNDIDKNLIPPKKPIWEGVLEDGDILYLPRGWWHEAKPLNTETVHLSLGINNRTGIDLLEWLKTKLSNFKEFRKDIPKLESKENLNSHEEQLKNILSSVMQDGFLSEFIEETDSKVISKSHNVSLPFIANPRIQSIDSSINFRLPTNRRIKIYETNDQFWFKALNKVWTFSNKAQKLIEYILLNRTFSINNLLELNNNSLNEEQIHNLIIQLIQQGLIVIDE